MLMVDPQTEGAVKTVTTESSLHWLHGTLPQSGEPLLLRPLQEEDATVEYLRWLNEPEVTKYLATKSSTFDELRLYLREQVRDNSCIFWGIFVGPQKKHVGNIKLYEINSRSGEASASGEATMGILIGDKNYWGKGIAKETIRLVMGYAFQTLNLSRISLIVASENRAAIKAYEHNQFKVEQVEKNGLHYGERLYDKVIMVKNNLLL